MAEDFLWNDEWAQIVSLLGGGASLSRSAKDCGAFVRARELRSAEDLLRLCFAYGPGSMSLRTLSAWAVSHDLAHLSDVAVMGRLQNCGDWLCTLIGSMLSQDAPAALGERPIRLVDGMVVRKSGSKKHGGSGLWRLHATFDLGMEAFDHLELSDQTQGERFDRAPVMSGEIRIGDRAYMQPERLARVLEARGDILVRAGWKNASWRDHTGAPLDLIGALQGAKGRDRLDLPIQINPKSGAPITGLRLVAIRKSPAQAQASREKARKAARKGQHNLKKETLIAAQWMLLVTSLQADDFDTQAIGALYRLRWRIELAFKRLKSLIGYKKPPAKDQRLARTFLLAHLLFALIAEHAQTQLRDASP